MTLESINVILELKSRLDPGEVISCIFFEVYKFLKTYLVCYEIMA